MLCAEYTIQECGIEHGQSETYALSVTALDAACCEHMLVCHACNSIGRNMLCEADIIKDRAKS